MKRPVSQDASKNAQVHALAHALNCVPDFVFIVDAEGQLAYANYAAVTHFGYSWDELRGQLPSLLFSGVETDVASLFQTNWSGELPAATKAGDGMTLAIDNAIIRGDDGKPLGVVSLSRNVTTEKLVRETQREREAHWRMLSAQLPAVLWTTDPGLCFTTSIGGGLAALGLKPNQVVGQTVAEYFQTQEAGHPIVAAHVRALAGESVHLDGWWSGRTYSTLVETLHSEDGLIIGTLGVAFDTTERTKAETELAHERDLLHALLENIPDYIYFQDHEGRYTRVNHAHARLLGLASPLEAVGRAERELLRADRTEANGTPAAGSTSCEPVINREERLTAPDGGEHFVSTTRMPLKNAKGETVGLVGISRDVTREKLFEQQLLATQKMATVSSLAGGIAHEFNNLLTGILGYTELLASRVADDNLSRNYLEQVKRAALEATDLTRQLSVFSQMAVIERRACNLEELLGEAIALVAPSVATSVRFVSHIRASRFTCEGDPSHLRQAFVNILLNACEAMPTGGMLTTELDEVSLKAEEAGALGLPRPGVYLRLNVRDEGCGMSEAVRRRALEPFFTTKGAAHTGLGLTTAYGIVQKHAGAIQIETAGWRGTTVSFYVPEYQPTLVASQPVAVRPAENATVLLVEDEAIPREFQTHILEGAGYRVLTAQDGEQGLKLFQKFESDIDLVVTDIVMPRLNGDAMVAEIRRTCTDVKVLAVSGYTRGDSAERLRELGVDGFVQKPFTGQVLLDQVRHALGNPVA